MTRPGQYDPDPDLPPPDELQPGTFEYEQLLSEYLADRAGEPG